MPVWNALVRLGFFLSMVFLLNAFRREKEYAREDYLTGLGNRRRFFELADVEIRRSRRYGGPFTVAYVDVDDFKAVNDEYGHSEGDVLLKGIAGVMKESTRSTDVVARLGGDEFAVLLPESGSEAAGKFIQKLHRRLVQAGNRVRRAVTFSIGVVTFETPPASGDEMVRIVDDLMYRAKIRGKDRVEFAVVKG